MFKNGLRFKHLAWLFAFEHYSFTFDDFNQIHDTKVRHMTEIKGFGN